MIKYILVLLSVPALAGEVRWATRPTADVRAVVEGLRACGVEGRVLRWRRGDVWTPHLLVTQLPARVGECRVPWLFLHDRAMLARVRDFMITHEGLLLNLRGIDTPQLVRAEGERGYGRLRELEPAIGDAVLMLRNDTDFYQLVGALKRFEDLVHGFVRKDDERFYSLNLPKALLEPTLNFIREARVAAASAHALAATDRGTEYQAMSGGTVMALPNVVVSRLYREQRLNEIRSGVHRYLVPGFEPAYRVVHTVLPEKIREMYDIYLADALSPADFRVLDLHAIFPRCADDLNP